MDHDLLGAPRRSRRSVAPPDGSGVYALFLKNGSRLPQLGVPDGALLYIGKADGAGGLRARCHFRGRTVNHSPRRSLAVLLRGNLGLELRGHGGGKWGLTSSSDQRLTEWMLAELLVAYRRAAEPSLLEKSLVAAFSPPLNLSLCSQGSLHREVRALRAAADREANAGECLSEPSSRVIRPAKRRPVHDIGSVDSTPDIAGRYGLDEKQYRAALRRQNFPWHGLGASWDAFRQSANWRQMISVAMTLSGKDLRELD